ncbi:MAG: carboxylesterase/lipase family protein [Pseudomonadota bacterium]
MSIVASTTSGPVEGRDKDGVLLFAGIPYAAPPVGIRRFLPPVAPEPWSDVRPAKRFSAAAPQIPSGGMTDNAPVNWDEDCLYLNVSTPGLDDKRRPVLVWIHGGGYRTGQGAIPWYDGASFARQGNIVTVSINYRLGALGFTDLSGFGAEYADSGASGILDQVLALKWVQDNIAAFGGDPARVTIAGESAGGFAVATLLASPLTPGLFRAAIPQSGACHHTLTKPAAEATGKLLLDELGVSSMQALLEVEAEEILLAQQRVDKRVARGDLDMDLRGVSAFYPVQGTSAIPVDPLEAVRAGHGADVNVLAGTNKDEATLFIMKEVSEAELNRQVAGYGGDEHLLSAYRSRYPDASCTDLAIALSTDFTFRIPCLRLAEARESVPASRGKTWLYLFAFESRSRLKSTHALEIPFAFNNLDKPGVAVFLGEGPKPQTVADTMHQAWINFIQDGTPGWAPFDLQDRTSMRFDLESAPVTDPDAGLREAWQGLR